MDRLQCLLDHLRLREDFKGASSLSNDATDDKCAGSGVGVRSAALRKEGTAGAVWSKAMALGLLGRVLNITKSEGGRDGRKMHVEHESFRFLYE